MFGRTFPSGAGDSSIGNTTRATLAWATDVHFDMVEPWVLRSFVDRLQASRVDALLIGGDTATATDIDGKLMQIAEMIDLPIKFVLGNHDYYGGSVQAVRDRLAALDHPLLTWLPASGPQKVAPGVTLVGHGGWGDARLGDFPGSNVVMTDYLAIEELVSKFDAEKFDGAFGKGTALEAELRRQGREAAAALAPQLDEATKSGGEIIVLTHHPPFREACWYEGKISNEVWLPSCTCGAMGDLLRKAAADNPECRFTVLCGHTHGGGTATIAPNLTVHTQAAEFGAPRFLYIQAGEKGVKVVKQASM
jgi:Icc protein